MRIVLHSERRASYFYLIICRARAKSDAAMVNEALCKFICHNICCVIMSQCELGIEAEFWQNEESPAGSADVLPMVRPG